MMAEARVLRQIAKNVTVKVPLTPDGLRACRKPDRGWHDGQRDAVLLRRAGDAGGQGRRHLRQPFVGRLDDIGENGMGLIADIVKIFRNYPTFKTEVLVASVRNPMPCGRGRQAGRPCRHHAAGDYAPAVQPSADRQGPRGLPRRLGQDRPADRLIRRA